MSTTELITAAIALVALVISLLSLWGSKRATRSEVDRSLILQRNEINDVLMRYGIKGPYAHRLGIPDEKLAEFTQKAVVLLKHLRAYPINPVQR